MWVIRKAVLRTLLRSPAAVQLIPLPFIAIAFWLVCNRLFSRPLQILSLKGAADLDRKDEVRSLPICPC